MAQEKKPLVSIIMPVFNAEAFLKDTIASIFAQSVRDWELIAVDDASVDNSFEIMKKMKDPRIVVLKNSENLGLPGTLNVGIDSARGKYIARIDADDIIFPEKLEMQVKYLECNPHIDVLGCNHVAIDMDWNIIGISRHPLSDKDIKRGLTFHAPVTSATVMARSEWLKKWKYDDKMKRSQDHEQLFRAQMKSKYANMPDILYVWRIYKDMSINIREQMLSVCCRFYNYRKNCIRKGLLMPSTIGIISLIPRPPLMIINNLFGIRTGIMYWKKNNPDSEQLMTLNERLNNLRKLIMANNESK